MIVNMCNVLRMCKFWKERQYYYYLWIVVFIISTNIVINEFHQDYNKKLYAVYFIIFCIRIYALHFIIFVCTYAYHCLYTNALACMQKL